ncbi:hypothetical protein KOI35_34930 [Actinoplanes bogorensis]|uniref:DUF4034 domain-containing protein n=1 Tax=Paractinoplanes bogorensis TaxID=1610840 RepID=A0ABS5YZ60_9ACTN|nr:hypothetical protein [Actinoplanes bogorensis]
MRETVSLDQAAAYPEVIAVRECASARDWDGARRVLDTLPPVGRTMALRSGGEQPGSEDFLRERVERDPADSAAAAALAFRLIDIAWEIRSSYGAEHVSRQQFTDFHGWLRKAEVVLIDAVARNPRDPALWTARTVTARGLELGLAEVRRRYDKAAALDPHHLPAQNHMVQSLCPKWSGNWELLHPFCREAMLAAPPGAVQGALVADAHIEHWFDLPAGTDTAYLTSAAVRDEIHEAAERSVLHPGFGRDYGWVQAASTFAFVFSVLNDRRSAARVFTMLGDYATKIPWTYMGGDTAERIRTYRRRALSGGTR